MKNSFLVIGGSGVVGSEVVERLVEAGENVRTTTGQKTKAVKNSQAEVVYVNLNTGEGIKDAFEGVSHAFLLSPSGNADQYKILAPLIQESKRRGLEKVVLMSAMGANANEASPLRKAELELEKSGLKFNIIRPNWFMQNFNTFWVQGIKAGAITLPAGNAKTSFIDARDIADVAVALLRSHNHDNKDFDITGSEALDHFQVASAISEVTGRKVTYKEGTPEALKSGLIQAGAPADYADFIVLIMGFLKAGYSSGITENVKRITGHEPRSFLNYVKDYKNNF